MTRLSLMIVLAILAVPSATHAQSGGAGCSRFLGIDFCNDPRAEIERRQAKEIASRDRNEEKRNESSERQPVDTGGAGVDDEKARSDKEHRKAERQAKREAKKAAKEAKRAARKAAKAEAKEKAREEKRAAKAAAKTAKKAAKAAAKAEKKAAKRAAKEARKAEKAAAKEAKRAGARGRESGQG